MKATQTAQPWWKTPNALRFIENYVTAKTGAYKVRVQDDGLIEYRVVSGAGIPSQLDIWKFYGYVTRAEDCAAVMQNLLAASDKMRDYASAFYSLSKETSREQDKALIDYDAAANEARAAIARATNG